jgi:WS/DGAT/MGAT family acyltransferase
MAHPFEEHVPANQVPMTRFDGQVSPFRVFTTTRFELDKLKAIRKAVPGSTINDVVSTIIAGGFRSYLDNYGELPEETLVALMPVNTRPAPDAEPGANNITFMTAAIGSDITDSKERLAFVQEHTSRSKTMVEAIGANELTDINKHVPASLLAATGKLISRIGLDAGGTGKRLFNIGISNVPGPNVPLYLKGAKLKFWSIVAPCTDGMGAVVAITSYDKEIYICPTACREMLPDPEFLAECIEQSYRELLTATVPATGRQVRRAVARTTSPKTRARKKPEVKKRR